MENTSLAVRRSGPRWEYLKYLLFWPAFLMMFWALERVWTPARWNVIHCALDDLIPFCEWFLIPYVFWYLFLAWAHVYTFFREPEEFRRLMRFLALAHTIAVLIFMLYPSAQNMRPEEMPRDNPLTRLLWGVWYALDTNTNTCPSLHVVDAVAVAVCACRTRRFGTPGWRAAFWGAAALIAVSTVFVKQHSVLDVLAAVPVCVAAYIPVYGLGCAAGRRSIRARDMGYV